MNVEVVALPCLLRQATETAQLKAHQRFLHFDGLFMISDMLEDRRIGSLQRNEVHDLFR